MSVFCVLCNKRISDWMHAFHKTIVVNGKLVHRACLLDHDINEVEKKCAETHNS